MKINIATIIKAQGIRGEVKLTTSLGCDTLLSLKQVFLDDRQLAVRTMRTDGKFLYACFVGIEDRNAAELLRGKNLFAHKEDLKLPFDTFLIDDILGAKVMGDDGRELGVLVDIYQNGLCADVYTAKKSDGSTVEFPFVKALKPVYDAKNGILTINSAKLLEVGLFEN